MKKQNLIVTSGISLMSIFLANCSSVLSHGESAKDLAVSGPTVLNERVVPKTIELNRSLEPIQTAEILADVKDFNATVNNVRLRFLQVPLEIPMKNIGGTTWRATLSPKDLRKLAVSGATINYDANVVAKDEKGKTAVSNQPLTVAIKAPDLARTPS